MSSTHLSIAPSVLYFGTPVVLITTLNSDGTPNITPMSSAWALGSSVVLGLHGSGQGAANLLRETECTLNFPSADLWPKVEKLAPTTGTDPVPDFKAAMGFHHEADKFSRAGFTQQESETVRPPRIRECPLQFEARLLAVHESLQDRGALAEPYLVVEVSVSRVHAARELVVAGTSHIDTAQWNPLFYVFRHYFGKAIDLGKTFRAER